MAIEITGLPASHVQESSGNKQTQALQGDTKRPQQQGSAQGAATSATDQVTLTETAAKLQKLEKQLSNLPVVDQERVAHLQKAIASGEYKVDPAKTAEKLVQFETAFSK
jgi:negative regulator of flagellin synthesis FlgM